MRSARNWVLDLWIMRGESGVSNPTASLVEQVVEDVSPGITHVPSYKIPIDTEKDL